MRSNVAPGQYVPVVRLHEGSTEGMMMRWGLIPSWAEGEPLPEKLENADLETIESAHSLRMPWLSSQRCILPMAGFYVWEFTSAHYRQPHFVSLRNRDSFGVAAVWDRSVRDADDVIESCCIVRMPGNRLLGDVARTENGMPAILRRRDYDLWLRGTPVQARAALHSYKDAWMARHPVSPRINSLAPDDLGLRQPV